MKTIILFLFVLSFSVLGKPHEKLSSASSNIFGAMVQSTYCGNGYEYYVHASASETRTYTRTVNLLIIAKGSNNILDVATVHILPNKHVSTYDYVFPGSGQLTYKIGDVVIRPISVLNGITPVTSQYTLQNGAMYVNNCTVTKIDPFDPSECDDDAEGQHPACRKSLSDSFSDDDSE